MNKIDGRKKICIMALVCVIAGLILAGVILCWDSIFITTRGEVEGTRYISDEVTLEQDFQFEHTNRILIDLMVTLDENTEIESDAFIIFTVAQEGTKQEYRKLLSSFPCSAWQSVKIQINRSKFYTGDACLRISGYHLPENQIAVLITGGEQKNEMKYVRINDEIIKGMYLAFSYNHYHYQGFFIAWIFSASICFVLLLIGKGLMVLYRKYPMTANTIVISIFFILRFRLLDDFNIDGWIKQTWLSDYRYGLINRGFLATIFSLISKTIYGNSCIGDSYLKNAALILTACILALVIRWIWILEKDMHEDTKEIDQKILMIWICSPWFFTFFMTQDTLGRLDIVLMMVFIICCERIMKRKAMWMIPILCVCGVLTYEVFTIIYFPTIFALLIEISYLYKEKRSWIITFVTTVCVLAVTLYIHFFGTLVGKVNVNEYYQMVAERTGEETEFSMVVCYPFGLTVGGTDISVNHLIGRLFLLLLLTSPILIFLLMVWLRAFKRAQDKYCTMIYMLFFISPFSMVVLINASDCMRYFVGIYTSLVNGILVSDHFKKIEITDALQATDAVYKKKFGNHYMAIALMLLMMLGVSYGTCWPYTEVTDTIIDRISDVSQWLLS